jgi:hypothetical protein
LRKVESWAFAGASMGLDSPLVELRKGIMDGFARFFGGPFEPPGKQPLTVF